MVNNDFSDCPMVSMIVVNYNGRTYVGEEFVKDSISSILESNYPLFEVILVDNASDDGTVEMVETLFGSDKRLKIIRNIANLGFAGGCNSGLRVARGEYIVLLNNDSKPARSDWLAELVSAIRSHKSAGACQTKQLSFFKPGNIDSVGSVIDYCCFIRQRGYMREDIGQLHDPNEICVGQPSALIIGRKTIEELGGLFDDRYFILHDDTDLSWRLWLRGYKIVLAPKSEVYHIRSATMTKLPPSVPAFHGKKNAIMTLTKNYGFSNLIKYLPLHIVILLSEIVFYALRNRGDLALATIRAILWNLRNLRSIWQERMKVQYLVRRLPDSYFMKLMDKFNIALLLRRRAIWPR